jgi:cell pole-organizing protein PopZ
MNERRSLTEGIEPKQTPPANPDTIQKQFVYGEKQPKEPARVLVSTRIRGDYARALKHASLQRQLDGITPNTLQDILEEAIKPWLKKHGHL